MKIKLPFFELETKEDGWKVETKNKPEPITSEWLRIMSKKVNGAPGSLGYWEEMMEKINSHFFGEKEK